MYVYDLKTDRLPESVGNKAHNLRRLHEHGFAIPATLVVSWQAFERHREGDSPVLEQLNRELSPRLHPLRSYAVRSSADVEDSLSHSFAGQFRSFLDVHGVDGVLKAASQIWDSATAPSVESYRTRLNETTAEPRLAVLIQDMVEPHVSGVSFSRNPISGAQEVVIEAVAGSGEALVQQGVTPERWVWKRGGWAQRPEVGVLEADVACILAEQTRRIARLVRADVDLEWVHDGRAIHWVQLRDITSIAHVPRYSNRIAKEQLPGVIVPLVWSVNIPLVNGAWTRLLEEVTGECIDPLTLAKSFYYHAYYEMGAFARIFERLGMPADSLEMMLGLAPGEGGRPRMRFSPRMLPLLPRIVRFLADKRTLARRLEAELPRYEERFRALPWQQTAGLTEAQLLEQVGKLTPQVQQVAYLVIVTQLAMYALGAVLRGQLRSVGLEMERFDLTRGMDELQRFDPAPHLEALREQWTVLPADERLEWLHTSTLPEHASPASIAFDDAFQGFLFRFGHLSDSGNNFGAVPWRENRQLILTMLDTYRRPQAPAGQPSVDDIHLTGLRRRIFLWIYNATRRFRLLREHVNYVYTYGYGLLRAYFLALGQRWSQRGLLAAAEDVLYLYMDEVRAIVDGRDDGKQAAALVAHRKQEIERFRGAVLPSMIYGEQAPPLVATNGRRLSGTPTSRGYYSGPARVVRGIEDFGRVQQGEVVVIPYSDVGWTPCFAKAGAIVAESGGILSHSSIVAREYGLPAVVSVHGAMALRDGDLVVVDGFTGDVAVLEDASD